jgi:hypothetical protein
MTEVSTRAASDADAVRELAVADKLDSLPRSEDQDLIEL